MNKLHNDKGYFFNFLSGESPKRFYIFFYMPFMIFIFTIFILLSAINYPHYNLVTMDISDLGVPHFNPNGWYFWSIGMIFMGITSIPLIPYVYKRLVGINKILIRISSSFAILAVIGIIGIGIFPQFEDFLTLHLINAGFAFGGLYIAFFFLSIIVVKDTRIKKLYSILLLFIGWTGFVGFLITQIYSIIQIEPQWFFDFSLWEWILMFSSFSAYMFLIYIIPDKSNKKKP